MSETLTYLEEEELAWHCARINEFAGRTILLSHHQLFSAFWQFDSDVTRPTLAVNPRLLEAFHQMNATRKIGAWYWGHEHTLSIYKPYAGLERGRCIGHGAVPVSVTDDIYHPLADLESAPSLVDDVRLGARQGIYNHGYAELSFHGGECQADYLEATKSGRKLLYTESF